MLCVCVLFAVDFNRTGKEFQSGQHQRNVFYFSLMVASSFKFVMMMMELRYFTNETCAFSHTCSFLRFAPDIPFLAAYFCGTQEDLPYVPLRERSDFLPVHDLRADRRP